MSNNSNNYFMPEPKISDRPPRVLLVYPYSLNRNYSPPIGLALIGAVLLKNGCEVQAVDAGALLVNDGKSRVAAMLESMKPDAVGLSLIVGNAAEAYKLIEEQLRSKNIPIIAGGPHATVAPDEALSHGVHIVVRGEGEETMPDIADWLRGRKGYRDIAGISFRGQDGTICHNPDRPLIADLDSLPLPAHDLFDPSDYFEKPEDRERAGKLMSSRGCPNKCSFCANPIFGRKFRYRSPDSIVSEMEMLRERYGIERFEFVDDAFTANRGRLLTLSKALQAIPDVTFSCVTRLENLDEETVPALRAAGLYRAHIGVESARPETLRRIHKNIDIARLEPALRLLRKNGVETIPFFMFGFPWETAEEMRVTNKLIERLRPLVTWYNEGSVVCPYPGTEIYEEYHKDIGFTQWWLTLWQPSGAQPLHRLQPYYFFPYDEERLAVIREALDMITIHNRGDQMSKDFLRHKLEGALGEMGRLESIIGDLELQVRDRDRRLRELWDKSPREKARRILRSLRKP